MRLKILTMLTIALVTSAQGPRATETPPATTTPQIQGGPAPFEPDLTRLS